LELGKVQRELFALDEFLSASKQIAGKLPFTSSSLQKIAKEAGLNMLQTDDRTQLINRISFVRRTAPTVQISFASDPSARALRVLVRWFRENGHPNTLITVGVQPNITGGCIVRTATKEFDFSLQQLFKENRQALAQRFV
jgi:F0F1-type ATP synthase delta subunit